jgi:nitrite reductase/ring-hydroxylating ferredoxin subunit
MAFTKVVSLDALPPGTLMEAIVGDNSYAVCNVNGEVYALDGICAHAGGPLGQGALNGDVITCPWHAWEYNCRTGVCIADEDIKLEKIPAKIEGRDVLIDVP